MSLSKELCLRSDSQNSDSFSDRICDDLCEVILQYLSLEDKLRLQCVSKQFERTVFQRQYKLLLNIRSPESHKNFMKDKVLNNKRYFDYYYIENHSLVLWYKSLDSFETLLKKCPNITSIDLGAHYRKDQDPYLDKINNIFRLIIENCNNLSEVIAMNPIELNKSNSKELHQKFGPKIKNWIIFDDRELYDLRHFPNIEQVNIKFVGYDTTWIVPQLKLAKLKRLELVIDRDQEHIIQAFNRGFPDAHTFQSSLR